MPVASVCPDASTLQRFAVGQMPPAEVEQLAKHCEQCERCIRLLHTFNAEDTLTEAMAVQSTAPDQARDAAVAALIHRLSSLPSPLPSETSATVALGNTPPETPLETTQAGEVSLSPPQAADEIGRLGGYRVLKMLGSGGMGMVYQAEDVHLQRPIALKVMKAEVAKNPGNRERFLREARAAAKLKSDHVVHVYQVGEDKQVVFLAMEYLEGLSLDDWLKKGRKATLAQTVRIGRQIALGLADAHACGLIHRDIKPGNIWLDSRHQGRVKLLDFGLARGTAEEVHLTQSGAIVGTPAFMAPEQARGEKVDHRCDLFSLGVVLYRLTTGQMPFRGDNTMSILTALALDKPTPPRNINADIPPHMASLIERLLAKEREQRPATAKAVADELANIEREATQPPSNEQTLQAASASERSGLVPRLRYGLRKYVVAASLLLLFGGLAAGIVIIIRDPQGNKIAEVNAPKGSKVEIQDADAKANVPPKEEAKIAAPPLAPMQPGAPLSPAALVQHPAKLPGVRSWSIEKRDPWMTTVVAYRPDGKRLAVGDRNGGIRIWEPQSGRLVQMAFETHAVNLLAWSPDGKTLAVGTPYDSANNSIQLWDAQAGRSLWRVKTPPGGGLNALAWSADGRTLLAMVGNVGCLTLDPADGKLLRRVAIPCHLAAFSPDAKRLAGAPLEHNGITLWDVETGKEIRKLEEHKTADPRSLAWSPDGKRLARAAAADGVSVWQTESGERLEHYKELTPCSFVCWSPNGRTFAVTTLQGMVVVDGTEKGQLRRLEENKLASMSWSPDGKTIARIAWGSGGGGSWVRLYDAATLKQQRTLSEGSGVWPDTTALSSDGRTVAVAEAAGITLSSTDTGQEIWRLKDTSGAFALSPDGKRLATGGPDHAVILWEDGGKVRVPLLGHRQQVSSLAWSPDGKRLASFAEGDKRLLLWNADKGELLRESGPFPAPNPNYRMMWSADGRFLAFPAWPVNEVIWHIWDVEQNKLVNNPKEWKDTWLVFSPDGRSVLVGSYGVYRLRDRTSGKEVRSLPVAVSPNSWHPVWSPDGRLLAVPNFSGVELWRGDLLRRVRTLHSTVSQMHQVAFSPDGKWTFGRDGERLHIWETDTGRLRGILLLGEKNNGLTLAPDGHYTGNEQVNRGIVVVVQKDDGTQELLEPADFEQKYGFKNEPDKVHLLQPLPPLLTVPEGSPMGPQALVREPAELTDANSWTIETVNPRGPVKALSYRPDGTLLATGGEDGTIRIWDTEDGKLVRMLVGEPVESLSWSKDGKVLTSGNPKAGREWDVDTGRLLRRIAGVANPAVKEARSPDGKQTAKIEATGVNLYDASGKKTLTLEEGNGKLPMVRLDDANGFPLGVRLPFDAFGQLAVTADGHYRGNARVERAIRMVVQKRDGSIETLTPREFERKYGFKNEPDKVRLTDK